MLNNRTRNPPPAVSSLALSYLRRTPAAITQQMAKPAEEGDAATSAAVRKTAKGQKGNKTKANKIKKFFHCYLLQSQDPKHKRSTYIGFTVDPGRRIRQHK